MAHPRHKATAQDRANDRNLAKALQGAYGSGGSYGVGGGFEDDEPGVPVETGDPAETARDTVPEIDAPAAEDVHTRESEMNDEHLREARQRKIGRSGRGVRS
jgi:hypothetical protein